MSLLTQPLTKYPNSATSTTTKIHNYHLTTFLEKTVADPVGAV